MTQDLTMSVCVDADLWKSFARAADFEERDPADLIREFMRDYAERKVSSAISDRERRERQKAVEAARASNALEGFMASDASKAHAQRFIDGQIDIEDYLRPSYDEVHAGDFLNARAERK